MVQGLAFVIPRYDEEFFNAKLIDIIIYGFNISFIGDFMDFEELKKLYLEKKNENGVEVYRHISELFREAREIHRDYYLNRPDVKKAVEVGRRVDPDQSWRAFKGKNLEKLLAFMIEEEVRSLGLKLWQGKGNNKEISQVKRNLLINYGEFGYHLPDLDLVIFDPETPEKRVIAILSVKVTLRERIAQTGYWKFKLLEDEAQSHIKVFFITLDEDETLTTKLPAKKGRAIVEVDTDGCYVLSDATYELSDKVKMFDKLIEDLEKLINS